VNTGTVALKPRGRRKCPRIGFAQRKSDGRRTQKLSCIFGTGGWGANRGHEDVRDESGERERLDSRNKQ